MLEGLDCETTLIAGSGVRTGSNVGDFSWEARYHCLMHVMVEY